MSSKATPSPADEGGGGEEQRLYNTYATLQPTSTRTGVVDVLASSSNGIRLSGVMSAMPARSVAKNVSVVAIISSPGGRGGPGTGATAAEQHTQA